VATFNEHLTQVKKNLNFLEFTHTAPENWDWKVTISFYAGVHLINSHLAQTANLHYRSHKEVDIAINPEPTNLSICKLDDDTYYSYRALYNLSRRARYLIHEDSKNKEVENNKTYDKHFKRSLFHLDILLKFINSTYKTDFPSTKFKCMEIKQDHDLKYFVKVAD
jgi:hypothetical protein